MTPAQRADVLAEAVHNLTEVAAELEELHFRARTLLVDVYLTYLQAGNETQLWERRGEVDDLFWLLSGHLRSVMP